MGFLEQPAVKFKGEAVSLRLEIAHFPRSTLRSLNVEHSRSLGHRYITELVKSFCWCPEKEWILLHMVPVSVESQAFKPVDMSYVVHGVLVHFQDSFSGGLKASKTVHMENINPLISPSKQKKIVCGFHYLKGSKAIIIVNTFFKSSHFLHRCQVTRGVLHEWKHWICSFLSHTKFKTCSEELLVDNRLGNPSN